MPDVSRKRTGFTWPPPSRLSQPSGDAAGCILSRVALPAACADVDVS
jgi:hypothetical protein